MKQIVRFNRKAIGYFIYNIWRSSPRILYVHSLVIYDKFRGRGLFKHLLSRIKSAARHYNAAKIALSPGDPLHEHDGADYIEHVKRIISIYQAHGFVAEDGFLVLNAIPSSV